MMRRTLLLIATLIAFPASAQVLPFLKKYPPTANAHKIAQPRKFTIVNIVGSIDLEQIAKLQHHMDLHVDLDDALDADAIDIDP